MENQFTFAIGPIIISASVITTWGIMLVIAVLAWLSTRHLEMLPGKLQATVEGIVVTIDKAILAVAPEHGRKILPFIATVWLFLIVANLLSLIPGLHSPTRDLSVTSALAILVFFSVHWYGIRTQGFKNYLRHYLHPSPILLPFHIISEFTRTLALAIRLFGNMMSLEMAAMLILLVAGFLAPIPILMLHIIEALVQAYIFGMLALIYLASAIQSQHLNSQE
ncbi:F0F1 ATP synthase subunit A [Candidatus Methylobacter oryzae]|uniref:ATP synthase subunit a n=1 Tax=Candidatus Methylobacter oryzae TaxID=2497749 RepID=A0ABY3CGJ8_9GAMM|nr:F0F1 ATP synthase subunit A [Candidatus Methylobacter oryzae]TRX03016.1 F0F1 ATP synthase subunit A [Candidatus Methylobacter oryzae]